MLLFSAGLFAQYNFNCFVKVATGKEPLAGVTVKINGSNKSAASDANGHVSFTNLSPGNIKLVSVL